MGAVTFRDVSATSRVQPEEAAAQDPSERDMLDVRACRQVSAERIYRC